MTAALLVNGSVALGGTSGGELEATRVETTATLTDLEQAEAQLSELKLEIDELSARNGALTEDNSALQESVDSLSRERDRLAESIEHVEDLYAPLEADYQLLLELRKGLPETRPEAEAHLDRLARLALASNPARLGQLVDRVHEAAPDFLDWRFAEYDTTQEATTAYISSGANAFETEMGELRNAVLLSVANRLDGLLNVIDRVR